MRQTGYMSQVFLTLSQVADRVQRSRSSVHRDVAQGLIIPEAQLNGLTGAYLFTPEEAERYADAKADQQ